MAILKRDKTMILGLNADLAALITADATEKSEREDAVAAVQSNIDTEVSTRADEITRVEGIVSDNKTAIEDALAAEVEAKNAAIADLQSKLDNVIENTDEEALDSLKEIVDAFQSADGNLNTAITDLADAREAALQSAVDAQADINAALQTSIDEKLVIANNLSDLADKEAARDNLDTYSKSEIESIATEGGSLFITESIEVDNDTITLAHEAKGNVIFNFATVRNISDDGTASDIPVTVNSDDSKVYDLHADEDGQFDGKTVMVQYAYIA